MCVRVFVRMSLYANTCVLLACARFECVYMRIWLVWLVSACVWLCVCVSRESVKGCIHGHEVVCVCVCVNSRWFAWGFWLSCPMDPFCFVLTLLFLMDNQGHHLNTITPACLPLSLYFGCGTQGRCLVSSLEEFESFCAKASLLVPNLDWSSAREEEKRSQRYFNTGNPREDVGLNLLPIHEEAHFTFQHLATFV